MRFLPQSAQRLILGVCAAGLVVLAAAAWTWRVDNYPSVAAWIALSALAGTLKIRFPGLDSSYTLGFIAILLAASTLPFAETIVVSLFSMLVQCYWRPAKRPTGIQVLFNLSNQVISAAAAWQAFQGLKFLTPDAGAVARFTFAPGVYFLVNTGLVSWILALVTNEKFLTIWETTHLSIFPFYLVGAASAGVLAFHGQFNGVLLVSLCPLFGLLYGSMRAWVRVRN